MTAPVQVVPVTTVLHVTHEAGEPLLLDVPILGPAGPVEIQAGDVGLWSAAATIRRNPLAAAVLHAFTTGGAAPNAEVVAGAAALVRLRATAAETAGWQAGWPDFTCGWDLWITQPDDPFDPTDAPTPHRIAAGRWVLTPTYTR